MRVVFSFDDGRVDAYEASKILFSHNLCGTFHITTGFVDGSFCTDSFGKGRLPLTVTMIREMQSNGMEISSHGDRHVMEKSDFLISLSKIDEILGSNFKKIGFSVPNSQYDDHLLNQFREEIEDKLSYIRVGRSEKCYSLTNKIRYVLYHATHLFHFFKGFNKSNVLSSIDSFKINSLVIKKDTRIKHLIQFIDSYRNNRNSTLVLMFHSIADTPQNEWEYKKSDFARLCEYLSIHKEIEITTLDKITTK